MRWARCPALFFMYADKHRINWTQKRKFNPWLQKSRFSMLRASPVWMPIATWFSDRTTRCRREWYIKRWWCYRRQRELKKFSSMLSLTASRMSRIITKTGATEKLIHIGLSTHSHDQSMVPVNFNPMSNRVKASIKSKPPLSAKRCIFFITCHPPHNSSPSRYSSSTCRLICLIATPIFGFEQIIAEGKNPFFTLSTAWA